MNPLKVKICQNSRSFLALVKIDSGGGADSGTHTVPLRTSPFGPLLDESRFGWVMHDIGSPGGPVPRESNDLTNHSGERKWQTFQLRSAKGMIEHVGVVPTVCRFRLLSKFPRDKSQHLRFKGQCPLLEAPVGENQRATAGPPNRSLTFVRLESGSPKESLRYHRHGHGL